MTGPSARGARGRALLSAIDVFTLLGLATIASMIVLPRLRVRALLGNEDDVIADLADLEEREERHRASGATDANGNGEGEYAPLGQVLGPRLAEFQRIEGTDVWRRGGYYFTVLLPDRDYRAVAAMSPDVKPEYAEIAELLVAWPADPGRTGMRAYCRWPGGILLQHAIDGYPYSREPPVPAAPLIRRDARGARFADRYDHDDWKSPVFSPGRKRP